MSLPRVHPLLGGCRAFQMLDPGAQVALQMIWRRGASAEERTYRAVDGGPDAVDALLVDVRHRGQLLGPGAREWLERHLRGPLLAAELVALDLDPADGRRVAELYVATTPDERAWMERRAARLAAPPPADASDPAPSAGGPAPAPGYDERERLRKATDGWLRTYLDAHPEEPRTEARKEELRAHYRAHVYEPGKRGRKPAVKVAQPGNLARPEARNVAREVARSDSAILGGEGERDSLSLSSKPGDSDARATPDGNLAHGNLAHGDRASFPPDASGAGSGLEHPTRSSEPAPPPAEPVDEGARLVALLRSGEKPWLGSGSDDRLGAALLALKVQRDIAPEELVAEIGRIAQSKEGFPKQRVDENGNPRELFPAAVLAGTRSGDSPWLATWADIAASRIRAARRAAQNAADYERALRTPAAQQRLGTVGDNTIPVAGPARAPPARAPPARAPPAKVGDDGFTDAEREARLATLRAQVARIGKP